jgi:transcriptional regulator with XRE-family HTH domain
MRFEQRESGADVGQRIRSWRSHRKLSQMELAGMANISARHLSFIETGRGKASPATLLSLASTLQIPLQEQNHLLLAAGFAPRYGEAPITDDKMTHVRNLVQMILKSHEPFPAFAINRSWDIVASNSAHSELLARMINPRDQETIGNGNIMRLLFHPNGMRKHIVNWSQLSGFLMRSLQSQLLTYPGDQALVDLSTDIDGWTGNDDFGDGEYVMSVQDFAVPMTIRMQGHEISLVTTMLKFAVPMSATVEGLTIESFYPADAQSEAALRANVESTLMDS